VEGVLRKLTGDTLEALPSPRHTGLPVPNAYMNAAYPAIPKEVQTLLLGENVTVTDLSMDYPLEFDSDVTPVFAVIADMFTSPAQGSPRLPAPASVTNYPTPAEPPTVANGAHNSTATINHLHAQVPHDTQRENERALKQHKQAVNRTHNAAVKKRRTEMGLDLGAAIITQDVVSTQDNLECPTWGTKRSRITPVVPVMPTPRNIHPVTPPVPQPRIPVLGEVCAHGSTWSDFLQLDHLRHHLKPGQYLDGKHCTKCQTPVATVVAKKQLVFYCIHDFRAFTLDSADALSPCDCLVCPPCYASAPEGVGTGRRRRRT
jgi:hypothetical protein